MAETEHSCISDAYGLDPSFYGDYEDYQDEFEMSDAHYSDISLDSILNNCAIPTVSSAVDGLWVLLIASLICNLVSRLPGSWRRIKHVSYIAAGLLVLYKFFNKNSLILGKIFILRLYQFAHMIAQLVLLVLHHIP